MSEDAERTKRLLSFKKKLENRIERMSSDLKDSQAALETINSILIQKGFKHPETSETSSWTTDSQPKESVDKRELEPRESESPRPQSSAEFESVTPLKTTAGELLADVHVNVDSLRIVPADDKNFDVNVPPFMHFLVERVLLRMQERDNELARTGQLSPDKVFCYNIVRDGDIIREIVINNSDPDRLRELKSSVRWTLEKMYEKMKNQG